MSCSYKCCSVPCCTNSSIKTPNKMFLASPTDKKTRRKWCKLARREMLAANFYFCEDHFDLPQDMLNYREYLTMGTVRYIRKKPGCLPSKFYCQPGRMKEVKTRTLPAKRMHMSLISEALKSTELPSTLLTASSSSISRPEDILEDLPRHPSALEDVNNPDWVPSQNMGYGKENQCSPKGKRQRKQLAIDCKESSFKYCSVPGCTNNSNTSDKLFLCVPQKESVRNMWYTLARCADNPTSTPAYFCEDHFNVEEDVVNYKEITISGEGQVHVRPGCLPSRWACQPDRCSYESKGDYAVKMEQWATVSEVLQQQTPAVLRIATSPEPSSTSKLLQLQELPGAVRTAPSRHSLVPLRKRVNLAARRAREARNKALIIKRIKLNEMPLSCLICGEKKNINKNVRLFRVPAVPAANGIQEDMHRLGVQRRRLWLTAMMRQHASDQQIKHFRVCNAHFVSGKPSLLINVTDPDWVPTQNLRKLPRRVKQQQQQQQRVKRHKKLVTEGVELTNGGDESVTRKPFNIDVSTDGFCQSVHDHLLWECKNCEPRLSFFNVVDFICHAVRKHQSAFTIQCNTCSEIVKVSQLVAHFTNHSVVNASLNNKTPQREGESCNINIKCAQCQEHFETVADCELHVKEMHQDSTGPASSKLMRLYRSMPGDTVTVNKRARTFSSKLRLPRVLSNPKKDVTVNDDTPLFQSVASYTVNDEGDTETFGSKLKNYVTNKECCPSANFSNTEEDDEDCIIKMEIPPGQATGSKAKSLAKLSREERNKWLAGVEKKIDALIASNEMVENATLQKRDKIKINYECPKCGKSMKCESQLKIHERVHTGERPYTCHICGLQFKGLTIYKKHLVTHGEAPYVCALCDISFQSSLERKVHKLEVHNVTKKARVTVDEEEIDDPSGVDALLGDSSEGQDESLRTASIRCHTCKQLFSSFAETKQHITCHPATFRLVMS